MSGSVTGRLRIIGGRLRGRRLRSPRGRVVRPTPERVREALFDILGARIVGMTVLDAYAGTGAIGLEAISRGARSVTFLESGRAALGSLRANILLPGIDPGRVTVLEIDMARAVPRLEREGGRFDLVYLDPPYAGAELERALRLVGASVLMAPGALVVAEHEADQDPPREAGLTPIRTARYGRTALSFYHGR